MRVYDGPMSAIEGETVTIDTTAVYRALKPGFREVMLLCDTAFRIAFGPKLLHAVYYNAAIDKYFDYVSKVTDRDPTTHMPLDLMPATDIVYLGTTEPMLGAFFDIDGTNKNVVVATLDVEYCSTAMGDGVDIVFTDVSTDSDGTISGGATLTQDGVYTWALPAIVKSRLGVFAHPMFSDCYWTRFKPSATLSALVDVVEIIPVYKNVNYGYIGASIQETIPLDVDKVGGFLATCGSSKTLYVNWIK
jgi:hypothetical protein